MPETTGGNYCLNNRRVGSLVDIQYAGQNFVVAKLLLLVKVTLLTEFLFLLLKKNTSRKSALGRKCQDSLNFNPIQP